MADDTPASDALESLVARPINPAWLPDAIQWLQGLVVNEPASANGVRAAALLARIGELQWRTMDSAPIGKPVLVFDSFGDYYVAVKTKRGVWVDQSDCMELTQLIRWMPLPEPPK